MIFVNSSIVPCVMFHSVGLENHPWVWKHISESILHFETKLKWLKRLGYNTISWSELYAYMDGKLTLPKNSILLTFDDGYLDNWVYVYPLLKKYNMKGTIFVNKDFVDPSSTKRANLDDVWKNRVSISDLEYVGFLSWEEMREMEASELVDIQSHSETHTWFYSGPEIVDIHRHSKFHKYPWLSWNMRPERKPYYLNENQQSWLPEGFPILEHEKSLVVRRFFPNEGLLDAIGDHISSLNLVSDWRGTDSIKVIKNSVKNNFGKIEGCYESDPERYERIYNELSSSKSIIEENLIKRCEYICWPGGGNDKFVHNIAKEVGYKAWTLSSRDSTGKRNIPGADPESVKRMGSSEQVVYKGKFLRNANPIFFIGKIMEHQHSLLAKILVRLYILISIVQSRLV